MFRERLTSIAGDEQRSGDACMQPTKEILPLISKLRRFVSLASGEVAALERLSEHRERIADNRLVATEGNVSANVCLITSGIGIRHKGLSNGRRQILGYVVPGDFSDPYFHVGEPIDHSVTLLGNCGVAWIWAPAFRAVLEDHPNIERGLAVAAMVDQAILREWLLNIGQRNAYERLSHFFCEMGVRLQAVNLSNPDGSIDLPLSQSLLADTTGLTLVHLNRTLKRLRDQRLITLDKRRLTIPDLDRLIAATQFEKDYLQGASH